MKARLNNKEFMSEETLTPQRPWLTVQDAANYAAVSTDTIYTACERQELRHVKVGGRRAIRLRIEWIDRWLEQHSSGAETPPS